jgi:hypothetical protein
VLPQAEYRMMRQKLNELPDLPAHPRLAKEDWLAAGRIFLLVFFSTLSVTIPFLLVGERSICRVRVASFSAARKNRLDLSVGIALGSASQNRPVCAPGAGTAQLYPRSSADGFAVLAGCSGNDADRNWSQAVDDPPGSSVCSF